MNRDEEIRYYRNGDSTSAWTGIVCLIGLVGGGASIAAHSVIVTSSLVTGCVVVWYLGFRLLSSTCYFISPTVLGVKDAFRLREVPFTDIRRVTRRTGRSYSELVLVCESRTISIPLDIMNEDWFIAVKTELRKRNIPVFYEAFGFPVKGD